MNMGASPLLEIRGVSVEFSRGFRRPPLRAVDDASLQIGAGETVGLVGESGSGKTTLGRAVLGLVPIVAGSVHFEGVDITGRNQRQRRSLGRDLQVVFQDPYSSLNPARTVGKSVAEPLEVQRKLTRREIQGRVSAMLEQVGLPRDAADRYPIEFSGGQRQRVAIARALVGSPKLVICDEVTSSLDLSVQAQILNLLRDLQQQLGVAYLFIGHNLAVVRHVSSRIAAMYRGQIVEYGPAQQVYEAPTHPYTRVLVSSAPSPDPTAPHHWPDRTLSMSIPDTSGCPYSERCTFVMDRCRVERPELRPVLSEDSLVACHLYDDAANAALLGGSEELLGAREPGPPRSPSGE